MAARRDLRELPRISLPSDHHLHRHPLHVTRKYHEEPLPASAHRAFDSVGALRHSSTPSASPQQHWHPEVFVIPGAPIVCIARASNKYLLREPVDPRKAMHALGNYLGLASVSFP